MYAIPPFRFSFHSKDLINYHRHESWQSAAIPDRTIPRNLNPKSHPRCYTIQFGHYSRTLGQERIESICQTRRHPFLLSFRELDDAFRSSRNRARTHGEDRSWGYRYLGSGSESSTRHHHSISVVYIPCRARNSTTVPPRSISREIQSRVEKMEITRVVTFVSLLRSLPLQTSFLTSLRFSLLVSETRLTIRQR